MKDFVPSTSNRDSYFLNFSDGMPMFGDGTFDYYGDKHYNTLKDKLKKLLKKVFQYCLTLLVIVITIEIEIWKTSKLCMVKTLEFVDVSKVSSLAKTMNNLFLEKN